MQTLIAYASSSREYLKWLEAKRPDRAPSEVPFLFPGEARTGDRYLLVVGGADQTYVGWGRVESNWQTGRGAWAGHDFIYTTRASLFREPKRGSDIEAATGFRIPRRKQVIPDEFVAGVWRAVTGKKLTPTDRAVEGILTETRSRYRHPGLRLAALQRAKGRCECCGVNFHRRASGLGSKCLVVHHKKQLKDTDQPRETRLSDLAVVCANCHMMIHANPAKALSVGQLRTLLKKSVSVGDPSGC
jgi:hypothetical protein